MLLDHPEARVGSLIWLRWAGFLLVAVVQVSAMAEELRIGGTGTGLGTMQLLGQVWRKNQPDTKVTVLRSLGSGGGIKAVLAGQVDVAVSSRPLKDAEIAQGARQTEYGRTPFVFVVHRNSKVSGVSTRELADIYAGRTESWPDGTRIRLVLRPVGDTDSETIKTISPEVRAAKELVEQRKGMSFAVTDQEAADSLEKIPGAFGPSTLALILTEQRPLKPLRFNGVEPTPVNIENGSYPLMRTLYLVTSSKSPPAAQRFVDFVQSVPARELLRKHGYAVKRD